MYTDEKGSETLYDAIANTGTAAFTAMVYTDQSLDMGIDFLNTVVNDPSDITKYAAGAATLVAGFRALQNYSKSMGYGVEREQNRLEKTVDNVSVGTVGYGFYGVLGKTAYDNYERIKEYLGGLKELVTEGTPGMQDIVADNLAEYTTDAEFVRGIYTDVVSALPEGAEQMFLDIGDGFEYASEHPLEASFVGGLFAASYLARKGVSSKVKRRRREESRSEVSEDI